MIPQSNQHLIAYALDLYPDLSVKTILIAIEFAKITVKCDLDEVFCKGEPKQ